MPGITEIFRTCGPAYRELFDQTILPSHRKTIADIIHCRTAVMGGDAFVCDSCNHVRYAYHSCKNRSCPTCHESDRITWLEKKKKERLPVPYFHAVFTLPKELHPIIKAHQKIGYALIMEAAALSLMKLAADARYVGGQIGMLAVLHTWTRALVYHPGLFTVNRGLALPIMFWIILPDTSTRQPSPTAGLFPRKRAR